MFTCATSGWKLVTARRATQAAVGFATWVIARPRFVRDPWAMNSARPWPAEPAELVRRRTPSPAACNSSWTSATYRSVPPSSGGQSVTSRIRKSAGRPLGGEQRLQALEAVSERRQRPLLTQQALDPSAECESERRFRAGPRHQRAHPRPERLERLGLGCQ